MSYPGSPAPGMVGGIAVDSTELTAFDPLEKVQLLFDKNTGALLTTAVGNVSGGTQVEGIHVNNTQVSNPLPTGGFANNGDGVTVVGLRAAFNGGDSMGTLFVQLDPTLTSTVAVSGTVSTQSLGEPGAGTGDRATATAGAATITYAAGAGAACNYISSVHLSYSGSATLPTQLAPGNLLIKDGTTTLIDVDIPGNTRDLYFDPPIQGTAATAMSVVLGNGGTAVVGKVNARHYQQ